MERRSGERHWAPAAPNDASAAQRDFIAHEERGVPVLHAGIGVRVEDVGQPPVVAGLEQQRARAHGEGQTAARRYADVDGLTILWCREAGVVAVVLGGRFDLTPHLEAEGWTGDDVG